MALSIDADYFIHRMRTSFLKHSDDSVTKRIISLNETKEKDFLNIQKQLSFNNQTIDALNPPVNHSNHNQVFDSPEQIERNMENLREFQKLQEQKNKNSNTLQLPIVINKDQKNLLRKINASDNNLHKLAGETSTKRSKSSSLHEDSRDVKVEAGHHPEEGEENWENLEKSEFGGEVDAETNDDDNESNGGDSLQESIKVDLEEQEVIAKSMKEKEKEKEKILQYSTQKEKNSFEKNFVKIELPEAKRKEENRMSVAFLLKQQNAIFGKKSALTSLINDKGTENPFANEYGFFCGKGDADAIILKIYIPYSDEPSIPLKISVKRDAKVEECIGYALYEYFNEGRTPILEVDLCDIACWNMRIMDDDGTIDDDFPALERARKIGKFSFDQFALTTASPDQIKLNKKARQKESEMSITLPSSPSQPKVVEYLLRIHLYSTIEVKQTTTLKIDSSTLLSVVFEKICQKRKYDIKEYILKMADAVTDAPLDKTLEQLKVQEFCVLKRDRGGLGDIYLRPMDENNKNQIVSSFQNEDKLGYKNYSVVYKNFMGRYDRLLSIDGDNIFIASDNSNKKITDLNSKMIIFHISNVISCKNKNKTSNIKLIVKKNFDTKSYELEGKNNAEAAEICARIDYMISLNKRMI
ncbi:hypothetical protein HDU92_003057 [Lobulomyces angularis]|nr:hypothetical protein HDU92_003057 [Lobulomyces angularis]